MLNGKTPIILGGTGLYINAVVNNMKFDDYEDKEDIEEKRKEYREKLEQLLKEKKGQYLYELLKKKDIEAANQIHQNNVKRIMRALEMIEFGTSKTDTIKKQSLWNKNEEKYKFYIIYIDIPREILYYRINERVDAMVKDGVLEEAKMIKSAKLPSDATAMQAIGYKEFFPYLEGICSLQESTDKLKQNTRKYAKRQITWFKKLRTDYVYHLGDDIDKMIKSISDE